MGKLSKVFMVNGEPVNFSDPGIYICACGASCPREKCFARGRRWDSHEGHVGDE